MTDLPFDYPDAQGPSLTGAAGKPAKCKRHPWKNLDACPVCGHPKDVLKVKRGKNAGKRGNFLQAWFCLQLGLENIGRMGTEVDGINDLWSAQIKSGQVFPGWMQKILDTLPRTGGRIPILGIVATPGPGNKRRALVVMDLDDFRDLHG